ncbi:MAG: hypothetical protein ACI841_004140 [Planctomycetota bacterium]|jgi:hypothetical protein
MWPLAVSHREGSEVPISSLPTDGTPACWMGQSHVFDVSATPSALHNSSSYLSPQSHVGLHYTRGADQEYSLKTGSNSPENFLAYRGFDEVADHGGFGILHHYAPHVADW